MMDSLSLTIYIFSFVLLSFVIIYSMYYIPSESALRRIECKSIFKDWRFWVPVLIYSIVLGFRYDYGYDWDQYYNTYNYIQIGQLYRDSTEIGYLLINRLLGLCGGDFYSILILEGFVYILGVCFLLKENRRIWLFTVPIVYMINKFNCLNISRQFFSMSVMLIGYRFLLDSKKTMFLIFSLIACSIHTVTVLYVIPLYYSQKLKYPPLILSFVIYVIIWSFQHYFFDLTLQFSSWIQSHLLSNKMYDSEIIMRDKYFSRHEFTWKNILYTMIKGLSYMYGCYLYKDVEKNENFKRFDVLRSIMILGFYALFFNAIAGTHEIITRTFYQLDMFTHIGWGIIIYFALKNRNQTPFFFNVLIAFFVVHTLWSFYYDIYTEFAMGIFLNYKAISL